MEALKIYLMMALISAIVAVSYRKAAPANTEQPTDRGVGSNAQILASGSASP
jgi:hypothetical protein